MKPRLCLAPWHLLLLLAGLVGALTILFGQWTATSALSFPRFLLALAVLVYCPGHCLVRLLRLSLAPLEWFTVALLLGMTVSSLLYAFATFLGVSTLFYAWPLATTLVA